MTQRSALLKRLIWIVVLVALLAGSYGIYSRIVLGHQPANYGSYIPWGLWVAGYIYMIGLSAGAFLMSALVYVFRVQRLEKIGKLALLTALATLIGALLMIWQDIGHPLRAWKMMFNTNFGSVMGWMVWLYGFYFILLLAELWFALRTDLVRAADTPGLRGKLCRALSLGQHDASPASRARDLKVLRVLGMIGVPLAIAFHGSVGAIFGSVIARPFWNSGLTPILFLVGALLSGGALLTFITAVWGPKLGSGEHQSMMQLLGQIVLGLLALDILLEWAEYSIGLWNPMLSEAASYRLVLFGPYGWVFWGIHIGLGIIVPGLLLVFGRRSTWATALAGALIALTFLSVRLNIVIPGLAVEEIEGIGNAFAGPGLTFSYFPSLMEWLVFIWDVALAALIFLIGHNSLPVTTPEPDEATQPQRTTESKPKLEVA